MIIESCDVYLRADNYYAFSKMLGGPGYFPFFRSYEFAFFGEPFFTTQQLINIIPSGPVAGIMQACSFVDIQEVVKAVVSWEVDVYGNMSKTLDAKIINARTFLFFDAIPLEFVYENVQHCFIYKPGLKDYFLDTTLWSFCFVLLSSDNQGLLFYGKTWNSSASCISENLSEACWRKGSGIL